MDARAGALPAPGDGRDRLRLGPELGYKARCNEGLQVASKGVEGSVPRHAVVAMKSEHSSPEAEGT